MSILQGIYFQGDFKSVSYTHLASVFEGAVTTVEMHNELRDTPKTGDDRNPALWLSLLGVSAAGAAVLSVIGLKKKSKKEDTESVSYTHLDVYKRQAQWSARTAPRLWHRQSK